MAWRSVRCDGQTETHDSLRASDVGPLLFVSVGASRQSIDAALFVLFCICVGREGEREGFPLIF